MTSFPDTRRSSALAWALPTLAVLCTGGAALPWLPHAMGWENGPLENLQVAVLAGAAIAALHHRNRAGTQQPQQRAFWSAIGLLWFLMAARELSWGAVFCTPLHFDALTGPTFSSTQQLWYRPAVVPIASVLLLWCLWQFWRARLGQIVWALQRARALPLTEVALFAGCMAAAAAAEHAFEPAWAGFIKRWLDHAAVQGFEELAELCGYAALVYAQARVARFWHRAARGAMA